MRATDGQDSVRYDVVVVGAGAAGLSGAQPSCGARPPSARNSKEAEQRTGDATLSDELHAEHREGCGDVEAEQFWEDRYRRRGPVWSGRPNPVLVDSSEAYVRAPRWTSAAAKEATRSGSPGRAGA